MSDYRNVTVAQAVEEKLVRAAGDLFFDTHLIVAINFVEGSSAYQLIYFDGKTQIVDANELLTYETRRAHDPAT